MSSEPEAVEDLDLGGRALSSCPERDPTDAVVGMFISTWRRGVDGVWRVVLDTGLPPCEFPAKP